MGRLIDADALKEAIKKELPAMSNWGEHFIPMLIDNAPTVEPEITEEQAIDKLCETGWLQEHDKQMTERPHGEWITIDVFVVKCSVCGVESFATPFCPRCGADMGGNANDG